MNKKTLTFNNVKLHKKEFYKSKEPIWFILSRFRSDSSILKFKHNDEGFKYFIDYQKGDIVKPLLIILPQMNGYIKYLELENSGKNMSFMIKNDKVWDKYDKI